MSVKISIDKGSLNMTMKSLDKKAKQINAAASEGLESVALDILADSQATLKENKNIATGKLINSGKVSVEYVSQGLFPASVEILNGSKALYYQQRGITNPVIIKIREVEFVIAKIIHNGKTIFLDSSIRVNAEEKSDTRGRWRVMTGTFKNER